MKRNSLNFLIDSVSALTVVGLLLSGLVLHVVLPPGSGRGWALWGWGRHDWGELHFWLAVAGLAVLLVHLGLHWQWICVTAARCLPGRSDAIPSRRRRHLISLATLLVFIGGVAAFVALASRSVDQAFPRAVHEPPDAAAFAAAAAPGEDAIRGSMTLAEAAAARGLSVEAARHRLGLPVGAPAEWRMGRLAANAGVPMHELRQRLDMAD